MRPSVAVVTTRPPVVVRDGRTRMARWVATLAALLLVCGLVGAPTAAAAAPVTTFDDLSSAFTAGGDVVLGDDITGTGQPLNVGAGKTVRLDLDGHSLSVATSGGAAIGVPVGTTLIVVDASGDGSITAAGGSGSAGIGGGGPGADGVNPTPGGAVGIEGATGATGTVTGGNGLPGGSGNPGGNGGSGGAVAGTAPIATGGNGATGGSGTAAANGGNGGNGGASSTTGTGGLATGGNGGAGGAGGTGTSTGGAGGAGGAGVSTSGSGIGGDGGTGGSGGIGAAGQAGGDAGVVTILGGTVTATGGSVGIGGGSGGNGDAGGNGGVGGAGAAGFGAGGTGVGGAGGLGGSGATGGAGGAGGAGGTITIAGATVTTNGCGVRGAGGAGATACAAGIAVRIGCGARGAGGPGGTAGANGASGSSNLTERHAGSRARHGARGADGRAAPACSGTVAYGPQAPTGVSAIAGPESAKVSFTAPVDGGTSPITEYTVTATDTTDPSDGGQQATGAAGPITVSGLTDGDVYTFTVKATNTAGPGFASTPSNPVSPEAPLTPTPQPQPQPTATPQPLAPQTPAATLFPSDTVIIAGLETAARTSRTSRTLTFSQRIITPGKISWRLDLSFYLPKKGDRRTARRKPIKLASGGPTAAAPDSIRKTIRLSARARAALKRHPNARLVLRTTLRLPNGRTIHATKTLRR